MAINFPDSPATNDSFTSGGKKWIFNGTVWSLVTANSYTIPTGEVTTAKILDANITTAKLASDAVTTAKILDANITAAKIASDAVTTAKILDANVTAAKLASGAAVTNIGYTPANIAGPTFTGTVVLPSTTSIGTVSSTEIGYVDGVTSAIQTQLDSKLTATTAATSNRNAIINGAMNVWQRGTSFTSFNAYAADRWYITGSSNFTFSRQVPGSTLPQFAYCSRMQRNSGSTDVTATQLGYTLETADSLRFAGKTITVSFWARAGANYSGTSNALYYVLATGTGTDQRLLGSGFTGTAYSVVSLVTLTTSWQRFSYTTTVPSTATEISHYFQANLNAGTAGANDYWDVTGVQLEEGAVATPFEFEDFGTTLAKCQRYYWRSATGLTTDANSRHAHFRRLNGYTMIATGHCAFPVTMRAEPTVALYNGNGVGFVDGYGNGQESYVIASGEGLSVYGIGILVKYTNSGLATTAAFNADPANISYWANIEASAEL
jgi:hypothetical protein